MALLEQSFKNIKWVDMRYCGYEKVSMAFILKSPSGETALVDTGTPNNYKILLKELQKQNVKRDDLTKIFLTHAHMDHSGNASLLARDFPNIKIYCHPTTLKRIADPKEIIKHMSKVLFARYANEFGDNVHPIPDKNLVEVKDSETISFANYTDIKVLYTPGHSSDHICFHHKTDKIVFTGDAFGNLYGNFTRPVYSCPFMFDSYQIKNSIHRIVNCGAETAAIAHFGYIKDLKSFGKKSYEWASKMGSIALSSKYPSLEVYGEYLKEFGSDFLSDHIIRGHYHTNRMGVTSVHQFVHGENPTYSLLK